MPCGDEKDAEIETSSLSYSFAARGGACSACAGVLRCVFVACMLGGLVHVHACCFCCYLCLFVSRSVLLLSFFVFCLPCRPSFLLSPALSLSFSLRLSLFPLLLVLLRRCCSSQGCCFFMLIFLRFLLCFLSVLSCPLSLFLLLSFSFSLSLSLSLSFSLFFSASAVGMDK